MKISVITVCYNAVNCIAGTMQSILNQSYENLEYIVVDGKSKDDTIKVVNEIAKNYPDRDVRVISEPDRGIYDAMNKGIKRATGEWICMMNAGDRFASDNVLTDVFQKEIEKNVTFLYSDLYKMTSYGRMFRVNMWCDKNTRRLVHQCIIYRKSLHTEHGYYVVTSQLIISDYLFFLQVPTEQIKKVDTIIAIYEGAGISETGTWCKKQGLCADVVFRHRNFWSVYMEFIIWRIKTCLPKRVREKLRLIMSGVD